MVSMIEAYRMKLKFSENEVQCKLLIAGSLEEEKQKLLEIVDDPNRFIVIRIRKYEGNENN